MSSSINLSLTNELRAFVDENTGDGSLFSTPSEFIRDLIREKKRRLEAAQARDRILEGYHDLIEGRTIRFAGDVRDVIQEAKRRESKGWN